MSNNSPDNTLLILGAADPEMDAIEAVARAAGATVVYATDDTGERVHPRTMYSSTGTTNDAVVRRAIRQDARVAVVECTGLFGVWADIYPRMSPCAHGVHPWPIVTTIDHHCAGDRGFGRPPVEYLSASSIGQAILWLRGHAGYHRDDDGVWHSYASEPVDMTNPVPEQILLIAAADHCLAAAYRGECPGVDPDALLAWRVSSRAAFQGRAEDELRADIEIARECIRSAPWVTVGSHTHTEDHDWSSSVCEGCARELPRVRDLRGDRIPELVEAAMIEGAEYMAGPFIDPRDPAGRKKYTVSGSPATVSAWMAWADDYLDVEDIYGDPERGFAGGYIR